MNAAQLLSIVRNLRFIIAGGILDDILTTEEKRHYCNELVWADVALRGNTPDYALQGVQKLVSEIKGKVGQS